MGGGRIDCYLDLASFYSYVAFVDLLSNLDKLATHGVQVEFHPILLGAIMQKAENKPPWVVKAKSKHIRFDSTRAARRVGISAWGLPANLMELAKTTSPLRALLFIKANYPTATFHAAMLSLFASFWAPPHVALADDGNLARALTQARDRAGRPLFAGGEAEVRRILAGRDGMRDQLAAETARALELGAFGAPWLWVTDDRGKAEPFFGSDRFDQVYEHLGVAHHHVELLPPQPKL